MGSDEGFLLHRDRDPMFIETVEELYPVLEHAEEQKESKRELPVKVQYVINGVRCSLRYRVNWEIKES